MSELKVKGFVELKLYRGPKLERIISGENLITTVGKDAIMHRFNADGSPPAKPSFVAFGTNGGAVDVSQVALLTESVVVARAALTGARNGSVCAFTGSAASGVSAETILEMGIFSLVAAGVMYARFLPQSFSFDVGLVVAINWTITIG